MNTSDATPARRRAGLLRQPWFWLLLVAVAAAAIFWARTRVAPAPVGARLAEAAPAGQDPAAFAQAAGPRPLVFPLDSGPHDDFLTEWWYYTGNLETAQGRHFGYQLTFFRRALLPASQRPARSSAWATGQVYMAHFAVTDVAGGRHQAFQRFARGAAGLAGAQAVPYRVWLDDWLVSGAGQDDVHLEASQGGISLSLSLSSTKPPVLQGEEGYSRKGAQPGNASYYYSLTRIASSGTIALDGQRYAVQGLSWMDHEFSSSYLGGGEVGWDWFSIQLDDGSELMLFQLRRADGTPGPFSSGTFISSTGETIRLAADQFGIAAGGRWQSPRSGTVYPANWRLTVPAAGLDLALVPLVADQEMDFSFRYWEGAVRVTGTRAGRPVAGSGYVELTGYSSSMQGQF